MSLEVGKVQGSSDAEAKAGKATKAGKGTGGKARHGLKDWTSIHVFQPSQIIAICVLQSGGRIPVFSSSRDIMDLHGGNAGFSRPIFLLTVGYNLSARAARSFCTVAQGLLFDSVFRSFGRLR